MSFFHNINDVVFAQDTGTFDFFAQQRTVELHTTNRRQVITVFGEEQILEQAFSCFTSRRLASGASCGRFLPVRSDGR